MLNVFLSNLVGSFATVWGSVADFVPRFLAAFLLILIGSIIADLVGKLVHQLLSAVRLDHALRSIGLEEYVRRAGVSLNSGAFFGTLVKWYLVVVCIMQGLAILQLSAVTLFLNNVVSYLPQVFVGALIMLGGLVIGEVVEAVVSAGARMASLGRANFLSNACRWAVWVFSALVALYKFGVTPIFSDTAVSATIIAFALAFGLAFGLGGQSAAAQFLARLRGELTDHK